MAPKANNPKPTQAPKKTVKETKAEKEKAEAEKAEVKRKQSNLVTQSNLFNENPEI